MESPTDGESLAEPVVFLPNVLSDVTSRDSESSGLYSVMVRTPTNIMAAARITPRTIHVIFRIFLLLSCWIFPVLYLFSPSKWLVGLTCKVYQTRCM